MTQKSIGQALKGYRMAAKAARAFQVAHGVALGCAAASLVLSGVRAVRKIRDNSEDL